MLPTLPCMMVEQRLLKQHLSAGHTRRKKILVSGAVHPESRAVIKTYAKGQILKLLKLTMKNGSDRY